LGSINEGKVQHLYRVTSHVCCLSGTVHHKQGQHSAYAAIHAGAPGLWPVATHPYIALSLPFLLQLLLTYNPRVMKAELGLLADA